jgi:gamma-glutamyltranspeptidase/glutathione hydrolase
VPRYKDFDQWMATFAPNGHAPLPGEVFQSEAHATTLEAIAHTEGESFYRGEIADRIAAAACQAGADLCLEDLHTHEPLAVEPLSMPFHDVCLHELPPNGQGLAALVAAGVFERLGGATLDPDEPATMHLQIECMKLGFADAGEHIGDPHLLDVPPASLIAADRLDALARTVDANAAQPLCSGVPQWSSTVYLATADAAGRAVSFIQSNYEGFGSGIVIDGTGIAMQNRGAGFVLDEGHVNSLRPGARPYHTIIPGFTTRKGAPHMAFGVMGGPMQPQGHLQVLARVAYGWNPQAALDAPRWRVEGARRVAVEPSMPKATVDALIALGHDVHSAPKADVSFGGGQVAMRLNDQWIAASDFRRDGQAIGS